MPLKLNVVFSSSIEPYRTAWPKTLLKSEAQAGLSEVIGDGGRLEKREEHPCSVLRYHHSLVTSASMTIDAFRTGSQPR